EIVPVSRQFTSEIDTDSARCAGHEGKGTGGAGHVGASRAADPNIRQLSGDAQAVRGLPAGIRERLINDQRYDLISIMSLSNLAPTALRAPNAPELAAPFAISLQAVSRHIQVLVKAGLVRQERTGRISRCRLDAGPIYQAAV